MKYIMNNYLKKIGHVAIFVRGSLRVKKSGLPKKNLLKISTLFPFDLIPDTITLDREKLTVVNRTFFRSARIISTPYPDILSVELEVGPFLGNVKIKTRFFENDPLTCSMLTKADAYKLKNLLAGYIIATQNNEDFSRLNDKQFVEKLSSLGKAIK